MCRAARPGARHSLARSLAPWSGQERAGRREGWAGGPAGKGQGGGRSVSVGAATLDKRSKLGRGLLCESPPRARKTRRRTGGRAATPHPACAGTCTAAAPPRPDRPLTLRRPPPCPQAADPAPAGVQSVGSSRAAPVPGLQRREVPAQLTSPRHEQHRGSGSSRSDSSARLGVAAAAAPARPPGAAHSPAPLRPPARRGSVRAHLAGLPSLSGTLRSRTRPRPQPGPDSPPGKGAEKRASQLANERASGTHPPPPAPFPSHRRRARTRPARPRPPRAHAVSPHTHRAPGIHTPGHP